MSLPTSAAPAETPPGTASDTAPDASPDSPSPDAPLTLRQEDFCRHYAATGNAAGAARDAGYAEGSARQTGHELLERPAISGRVRAIRAAWRTVERAEAQILLGRLEQAWDAAVEQGSASLMIRVVRLQAELSGLDRRSAHRRAGLWPLPGEGAGVAAAEAAEPGALAEGPIAEAVRRGRHRTERALAAHRASRKVLEQYSDFDEADWLATAQRLHTTVEERRLPGQRTRPDAPAMTKHDISLHPAADAPAPDSAPEGPDPTNPDISLHRAGLMPAEDGARRAARIPEMPDRPFFPFWPEDSDDPSDDSDDDDEEWVWEEWDEEQGEWIRSEAPADEAQPGDSATAGDDAGGP